MKFSIHHILFKSRQYLFLISDFCNLYLSFINRSEKKSNDKIIFIGEYFPVRIQRISKLLGNQFPLEKVLYISEWGFEPKLIGNTFNRVEIYRNRFHLKQKIRTESNIKLIHAFEPKAYFQYLILKWVKSPYIYDVQDIIVTYYNMSPPLKWQKINLKYEQKIFEESIGFISYSLELNEAFRLYKINKNQKRRLFFPLYCDETSFKKINFDRHTIPSKLVYIGGINHINDAYSSNFLPFINALKKSDLTFTIYPSPLSEKTCYDEYKSLEIEFKKFEIKRSLPFNQLDLSNYHFGVVPFEHPNSEKYYSKNKYASTMKFFVYLEMGIPILISEYWAFPAWITKRYNLGIVTNFENLDNINKLINEVNYNELLQNIEIFRNKFSLGKNRTKLLEFYNVFLKESI